MEPFATLNSMSLWELVPRATVLLLAAALLSWALRRGAAGTRHVLWTATFVALLALPVAAIVGVVWELPLLPAPRGPGATEPVLAPAVEPAAALPPAIEPSPVPPTEAPVAASAEGGSAIEGLSAIGGLPWRNLLLLIWGSGAGAALLSVLVGGLRLRAYVRRARPLRDPGWLGQTAVLRRKLGIRREVQLLTSSETATPMTSGWQRPVVLLPEGAADWSAARREVVLAHELVHVQRHDVLRQVLGSVALALYWFHPLSWLASRLAISSREQACDAAVLTLGARPSEYASHLLELAEGLTPAPAVMALPMVQRSQLERRIMAILNPRRPRSSRIVSALVLMIVTVVGISAATARPVPAVAQATDAVSIVIDVQEVAQEVVLAVPTASELPRVFAGPESWPTPVGQAAALLAQDATCRMDGLSGSFSGTMRSSGDRSEHSGFHNGDRMIQKYVDDLRLCMRIHGEVVMEDDGLGVRAAGTDSWVVLESEEGALHRLVITEGPGGIENAWSVDGRSEPFGADAQGWRDQMFTVLQGYWEASRIRGQQSSLRGQISSHRGHVSSMRGQISSHRGQVSSLRGQISSHRGQVSSLKGQISSRRGHVSSLKGQISSHRGQMSSLRSASRSTSDTETRARIQREIQDHEDQIRDVEQQIADYDLDARIAEIEGRVEEYGLEGKQRDVEEQLEAYDLDGKVAEIERQIEGYDLDGKTRQLEREIVELDADRRAEAIERGLEPEVAALRRLIRGL